MCKKSHIPNSKNVSLFIYSVPVTHFRLDCKSLKCSIFLMFLEGLKEWQSHFLNFAPTVKNAGGYLVRSLIFLHIKNYKSFEEDKSKIDILFFSTHISFDVREQNSLESWKHLFCSGIKTKPRHWLSFDKNERPPFSPNLKFFSLSILF